jgi:hypothetical protein
VGSSAVYLPGVNKQNGGLRIIRWSMAGCRDCGLVGASCLVFLQTNGLLPPVKLPIDEWEQLVLNVAASKIDREQTTRRLRKLVRKLT